MSFRHTAAGSGSDESWAIAGVPLVKAFDVGLTQDGAALIATSSAVAGTTATGIVETLDPATLDVRQSASLTTGFMPDFTTLGFGIPTTNDGRSWVAPTKDGYWGDMAYVTPRSLTPTVVTVPSSVVSTAFATGPWYAMSRDGERLIITQTAALSPAQPMLYLDAVDSAVKVNPAGLTFSTYFSLSDTGDRVLFDNRTVRDGGFNLIGPATLPTSSPSYIARSGLLTPDGTRVYVLAYRSDADTNTGITPRVFVFDATTAQSSLPVPGYFDVPDYPGCATGNNGSSCIGPSIAAAISLDGRTLFFAGEQKLLIVPVPATLSSASATARGQRRVTTVAWPVNVH